MYSLDKACDTVDDAVDDLERIVRHLREFAGEEVGKGAANAGDPLRHAARAKIMHQVANSLEATSKKLDRKAEMLKAIEDYLDGEIDGDFFECITLLHFHSNKEEKQ